MSDIDAVRQELSAVGAAVGERVLDLTRDIWQLLTQDIPELRGDDMVEKLLDASVEENVATLLHMFEHGLVPDEPLPVVVYRRARQPI